MKSKETEVKIELRKLMEKIASKIRRGALDKKRLNEILQEMQDVVNQL